MRQWGVTEAERIADCREQEATGDQKRRRRTVTQRSQRTEHRGHRGKKEQERKNEQMQGRGDRVGMETGELGGWAGAVKERTSKCRGAATEWGWRRESLLAGLGL